MERYKKLSVKEATLSNADRECLLEIRQVLERHNLLGQFGISLLHDHFPIKDNEILVESVDLKGRVHLVETWELNKLIDVDVEETRWQFDANGDLSCLQVKQI